MDYSYLLPPHQAYQLIHEEKYIKHYNTKGNIVRKVYHNVPLDLVEEQQILQLEDLLKERKVELPADWDKIQTLKYCYSGGFDSEAAFRIIIDHLKWRNNSELQILTNPAEQILKKGVVYTLGRDRQFRPLIFIQVSLISTDIKQLPPILNGLCVLLNIVQKHMLIPYHIEKWRIIIDLSDISLFRMPVQIISSIINVTQTNYTSTLEQIHLYNPPLIVMAAWKLIERLMHPETAEKIQFCDSPQLLHLHIDPDQLQQKYKGTIPNQTVYWPIITTYKQQQQQQQLEQSQYLSMNESKYYTINSLNDIEISHPVKDKQCCSSCNIF